MTLTARSTTLIGLALTAIVLGMLIGSREPFDTAGAQEPPPDTTQLPASSPPAPTFVETPQPGVAAVGPIIRVYKNSNAWFGENRDSATLASLGKTLGTDWFIHPLVACQAGIPAGTAVVLFTSNGIGDPAATSLQNNATCQANLATFLATGGVLIVDMGDNDSAGGYRAPGATGTPTLIAPSPCPDATLAAGTANHPIVKGPDGVAGTGDDLTNSNIDVVNSCHVAHGNLVDGITLPAGATTLMTAIFGVPKPVLAEYCHQSGRVIVDTLTKEFVGHQPFGNGPSFFLRNLLSYALSPAAKCNQPPTANAGGPYTGSEGANIGLSGTASDPDGDMLTISWAVTPGMGTDPSAACTIVSGGSTLTPTINCNDDGSYTATLTVDDRKAPKVSSSAVVTVSNVAPVLTINAPTQGQLFALGSATNLSGALGDAGTNDTHTCSINWDDGATLAGTVSESNGSGTCTGSRTFAAAGVYTIAVTVTDDDGASVTRSVMVVVYDPSAGFVTGGGWIDSPAGAYRADVMLSGKANFGFVSRYQRGATTPTGQTEFQFHVAGFNFHSSNYEWLVVAVAKAQYKGTGTVNGVGGYSFLLTATDGQVTGGGGVDKFRIKIWNAGGVVYDNNFGGSDDIDSANPQAINGGSIVIHAR